MNPKQSSGRPKASPVKVIDTHEEIVRDYLNSLERPPEPKPFNPVELAARLTRLLPKQ